MQGGEIRGVPKKCVKNRINDKKHGYTHHVDFFLITYSFSVNFVIEVFNYGFIRFLYIHVKAYKKALVEIGPDKKERTLIIDISILCKSCQ